MALEQLTDARVDRAMATLAESDLQVSEWKVAVLRTEMRAKSTEALIYTALDPKMSIEDRKQAVKLDPRFESAWEEHFKAVLEHETLKNKREREVLVIDLYRTLQASRRAGMMV